MSKFIVNLSLVLLVITPIYGIDNSKKSSESSSSSTYMEGRYEKTTTNSSGSNWTTIYTYPDGSSSKYYGKSK